jgi:hypothetical protein
VLETDAYADVGPDIDTAIFCIIFGLAFFIPNALKWVHELFQHNKLPS